MSNSVNLELPFLVAAQNQKHITLNDSLSKLDMMVQLSVISKTLTDKPPVNVEGAKYLIDENASGDWSGLSGSIAYFQDGIWHYIMPKEGWLCWVEDIQIHYVFTQSNWSEKSFKREFLQPDFFVCEEVGYQQDSLLAPVTGWNFRSLNLTKRNTLGSDAKLSIPDRSIKLPVGQYWVKISSAGMRVGNHKVNLRNVALNTDVVLGSSEYSTSGSVSTAGVTRSTGEGEITVVNKDHQFKLHHFVQEGGAGTWRFGASGEGASINCKIELWKL